MNFEPPKQTRKPRRDHIYHEFAKEKIKIEATKQWAESTDGVAYIAANPGKEFPTIPISLRNKVAVELLEAEDEIVKQEVHDQWEKEVEKYQAQKVKLENGGDDNDKDNNEPSSILERRATKFQKLVNLFMGSRTLKSSRAQDIMHKKLQRVADQIYRDTGHCALISCVGVDPRKGDIACFR